jgi:hypothetical protein
MDYNNSLFAVRLNLSNVLFLKRKNGFCLLSVNAEIVAALLLLSGKQFLSSSFYFYSSKNLIHISNSDFYFLLKSKFLNDTELLSTL